MIIFENASIGYPGHLPVISDLNLVISEGEFVTLIGESGSGKTTLLKSINGLVELIDGQIQVLGKPMKEWEIHHLRRKIGYVIQQIGLFPHMTVAQNVMYVPNLSGIPSNYSVEELLDLVNIPYDYASRYPRELSGGQQQRIGVARALAADPDILLMDEPFGAVDEITRTALQEEIKTLHRKLKKTIVFVTHDIEEALKLGERIILFREGRIEQEGSKMEMIFNHRSDYVKNFFGTKHLTSYLNTTKVGELVLEPIEKDENYDVISEDTYLIEVLHRLFNDGARIAVEKNGEIIGRIQKIS
ncbi:MULTISPECIES: ABC transporter ATP-binding protein [unclassified Fusibacter]|uniref:ABC transporter ATP-binding protein n=1 Tax=unclassified Fusibacter TaxID=2624464 RepID=UPI0010110950|nr:MULTISPECIES: ABC transporter ATP-binding protein [unclassified Fusibacter]MCK8059970.1 ABC transporter ATP-binding protein [Fusibacter sp. A2]NPE22112.1 ABC transporter ATP-binding protein [Fusibacter sp. A1]RXV60890.1 ABC transporter ATP-binding protein [Fusibacter sp. A1]